MTSRLAGRCRGEVCQQVTDYLAELFATGLLNGIRSHVRRTL
ncbi:MAG: hypothetical protein ACLRX5_02220 [Slackia sp.]